MAVGSFSHFTRGRSFTLKGALRDAMIDLDDFLRHIK
jgi:hypothetical protein